MSYELALQRVADLTAQLSVAPAGTAPAAAAAAPAAGFAQVLQTATTPASSDTKFSGQIDSAAGKYGVDPKLIQAVISQESSFNPNATSAAGAQGLMQLMPSTAQSLGVSNPYDPATGDRRRHALPEEPARPVRRQHRARARRLQRRRRRGLALRRRSALPRDAGLREADHGRAGSVMTPFRTGPAPSPARARRHPAGRGRAPAAPGAAEAAGAFAPMLRHSRSSRHRRRTGRADIRSRAPRHGAAPLPGPPRRTGAGPASGPAATEPHRARSATATIVHAAARRRRHDSGAPRPAAAGRRDLRRPP